MDDDQLVRGCLCVVGGVVDHDNLDSSMRRARQQEDGGDVVRSDMGVVVLLIVVYGVVLC